MLTTTVGVRTTNRAALIGTKARIEIDDAWRVIHASLQKCRPITAEMVVANVSMGRR